MKLKRGFEREDGMIFWRYHKSSKNGEVWFDKERFNREKSKPCKFWSDKEKAKKYRKDFYNKHREKILVKNQERIAKNKDLLNAQARERYKSNPERFRAQCRKYQKENNEVFRRKAMRRKAIKRKLTHPLHSKEIEKTIYNHCVRVEKCLGIKFHVDHIVPLSRGGFHHHANLHVIPAVWNMRKHTKDIDSIPECWNPVFRKN